MTLIWTKNKLPLSKVICWAFNEPTSHFGIVFDNGIVFHSNLSGTHVEWFKTFTKKSEIVYSKEYDLSLLEEEAIFQQILTTYDDRPYDISGFLYFSWRALLLKFLNKPLPSSNKWNNKNSYLCTELAGVLPENIVSKSIKEKDLSILTPYKLYLEINKNG